MNRLRNLPPLIRVMAFFQFLSAVCLVAMGILLAIHLNDEKRARANAAHDSCVLIVGLAHAAVSKATPKDQKATQAYINRTPLRNCNVYARSLYR